MHNAPHVPSHPRHEPLHSPRQLEEHPRQEPSHDPVQFPSHWVPQYSSQPLHPVGDALLLSGILDNTTAPIIGNAAFAADLKNSRRDCKSSCFLLSIFYRVLWEMGSSNPINIIYRRGTI